MYHRTIKCTSIHKRLSNGQNASLYIKRYKETPPFSKDYGEYFNQTIYYVAFVIGRNRKQCNGWYNRGRKSNLYNKQTGRCGLEGLLFAKQGIEELISQIKYDNEYIAINWTNDKRKSVYRYLKKIGFHEGNIGGKNYYIYNKNWGENE